MRSLALSLRFAPIAIIMLAPLFTSTLGASGTHPAHSLTEPDEIDRLVAQFTGARIGEPGGARTPVDRRLRLTHCGQALRPSWHGRVGGTVKVECPGADGWRIFIATHPQPQSASSNIVVKRGDPVTVAVRGRGFTVQQPGEAIEKGAIGDWIAVRTARRADPIHARIERPGLAVIPAD